MFEASACVAAPKTLPSARDPQARPGGAPIIVETPEQAPHDEQSVGSTPRAEPSRRRWTTAAAVVGGLVIGLLAALVGAQVFGDDGSDGAAVDDRRFATGEINSPDDLLPDDVVVPPGAGAASAEAAVTGFLDAEVDGDFAASFGFISEVDRAEHGSPEGWLASHADVVPRILGYELEEGGAEEGAGRATISALLTLEPGLDQVTGLTPAEAVVRWDILEGADGWGVSLQTSAFEPVLPDEAGAAPAALAWAEARQRCDVPANEHGIVVGSPALARTLCDSTGPVEVGDPTPLGDTDAQPVATAFGDQVARAARVVRIDGPSELAAVLVPVGDEWTVIGVLP